MWVKTKEAAAFVYPECMCVNAAVLSQSALSTEMKQRCGRGGVQRIGADDWRGSSFMHRC